MKLSNYVIICDEKRKKQIGKIKESKLLIMPNIPDISQNINYKKVNNYSYLISEKIIISYVGVFDFNRNIEELLILAKKNNNIIVNIAGFGALEDMVNEYSKNCKNIKYFGKVNYDEGLNIMKNSHVIYAMYSLNNSSHRYAAPNKYYEGLMLGKPIITSEGTLVGEHTLEEKTGFVLKDGINELIDLIDSDYFKNNIIEYGKNAVRLWNNKYSNYIEEFMNDKYKNIFINSK